MLAPCKAAGVDCVVAALKGEKYRGSHSVHVPPLGTRTTAEDGKAETEVKDRVLAFFREQLVTDLRTPAVEFRPNRRVFADQVEVSLVTTSPDIAVRYMLDGSEPTPASPVCKGPFKLSDPTMVKALALKKGMRPSGVAATVLGSRRASWAGCTRCASPWAGNGP